MRSTFLSAVACAADQLHHCAARVERRSGPDAACAKQSRPHDNQRPPARRALLLHWSQSVHLESRHVAPAQSCWQVGCWIFHFNLKTSGQSDLEITAALGIVPVLYNGLACVPLTGAPFRGDLDPNLVQGSLGPHESACQTASQLVQPFLHSLPVCPVHTDLAACDV